MDNSLVLDNIAAYLSYDDLKEFRTTNTLFHESMTRELRLRRKTQILINRTTLPNIMTSNIHEEIRWGSVRLNWNFQESTRNQELGQFFEKFGKSVKALQWQSADLTHKSHQCMKSNPTKVLQRLEAGLPHEDLGQLEQFLGFMPNLEELRFGEISSPVWKLNQCTSCKPITDVLLCLMKMKTVKLTSLHFGPNTSLSTFDLEILRDLDYELKNFTFTGHGDWTSSQTLGNLINSWSATLESLRVSGRERFQLSSMPNLKKYLIEDSTENSLFPTIDGNSRLTRMTPMVKQFPALKELSISPVTPQLSWNSTLIIPPNMAPNVNLTSLVLSPGLHSSAPVLHRLLPKCPNLRSLTTATTNNEAAVVIFKHLRKLEQLSMIFAMSTSTFTGLEDELVSKLNENLDVSITVRKLIQSNRSSVSVANLTELRELNLTGGRIDDASIIYGIAHLKNLKKLSLCHKISERSMGVLASHKISTFSTTQPGASSYNANNFGKINIQQDLLNYKVKTMDNGIQLSNPLPSILEEELDC